MMTGEVCGMRVAVCGLRYAGCGIRCAVYGVRYAVCGMRFVVCGMRVAGCGLRVAEKIAAFWLTAFFFASLTEQLRGQFNRLSISNDYYLTDKT